MASPLSRAAQVAQNAAWNLRAQRVAELAEEARKMSANKEHFVSHMSSNMDSIAGGFEQRPYGVSFARLPHERMSSPTSAEPRGRPGVVFARVSGDGLDYSRPAHRQAVDAIVNEAIASGGTAEDAYAAMRNAGVSWVNNWNGIGEAPELYAISASGIDVRRGIPVTRRYRFPSPDGDVGIVVDGNWRPAATLGAGQPEIRGRQGER